MSALIFVAVAVAWACYLVPKALEHHDESLRSRTVSSFSRTMRVLARREPDSSRSTKLVAGSKASTSERVAAAVAEQVAPPVAGAAPAATIARKRSRSAAARRRNVLLVLLVANLAVAGAAAYGAIGWMWQAAPAVLLVAWLVACRLMVRRERTVRRAAVRPVAVAPAAPTSAESEPHDASGEIVRGAVLADDTQSIPAVAAEPAGSWDPVAVPLPTYVSKPSVARTVRTIDLDSTGVWSSGRKESDSALVAEADAARRDRESAEQAARRATGS